MAPLVLAIDVGIRNLAYCFLRRMEEQSAETFSYNLRHYKLCSVSKVDIGQWGQSTDKLVHNFAVKFESILDLHGRPDVVIIEKQLPQSCTLRQLQFCIQSYFLGKYSSNIPHVYFQSGKDKLKLCSQSSLYNEKQRLNSKYRANKLVGEQAVQDILSENAFCYSMICQEKKMDDLCDAFLHALYYYNRFLRE